MRYNTIFKSKGNTTKVKKIILHPKYVYLQSFSFFLIDYDIALLHVKDPIDLSLKNVKPVCLPQQNDDPIYEEKLTTSGWGRLGESLPTPEQLMALQLPVVNRTHCNDEIAVYQNKTHDHLFKLIKVNNHMFCTGFKEGGKGACNVRNKL